jgi:hypothetical protein
MISLGKTSNMQKARHIDNGGRRAKIEAVPADGYSLRRRVCVGHFPRNYSTNMADSFPDQSTSRSVASKTTEASLKDFWGFVDRKKEQQMKPKSTIHPEDPFQTKPKQPEDPINLLRITREAECAEIEKAARKVFDKLERELRERLKRDLEKELKEKGRVYFKKESEFRGGGTVLPDLQNSD